MGGISPSPILNRTLRHFFEAIFPSRNGKRKQVHCLCVPFPLPSKNPVSILAHSPYTSMPHIYLNKAYLLQLKPSPTHHQPSYPLLFQQLLLLALFPLHHCMMAEHSLAETRHLTLVVAMVLLEVATMLQDAVQVFLQNKRQLKQGMLLKANRGYTYSILWHCRHTINTACLRDYEQYHIILYRLVY